MDSFLPPATPEQIAAVYAHLHVTHCAVIMTQWRIFFSVWNVAVSLLLPWLLLATGMSTALRGRAAEGAAWLLRCGCIARLVRRLKELDERQRQNSRFPRLTQWNRRLEQWTHGLRAWREWDPAFFRISFLYAAAYSFLYRLVKLPANLGAYHLDAAYGLTHQSFSVWISGRGPDWLDGFVVNTSGAVLVLWLIRFSPRRWPVILAAFFAGLMLLVWLLPQPPDSHVRPLPSGILAQRLHALADLAGLPQTQILADETAEGRDEANGSASRFGGAPRILLTRRMLNTEPPEQVEATVAHELGHCVYLDTLWTLLPSVVGVFAAFPFIRWLAERFLTRFGARWRVASLADAAALPLLLLSFHLVTLATDPLANTYSRILERRADAYGLALTRNRLALAEEYIAFCNQDGDDPNPPAWFVFWHEDHPSDEERLRFALTGQPGPIRRAR